MIISRWRVLGAFPFVLLAACKPAPANDAGPAAALPSAEAAASSAPHADAPPHPVPSVRPQCSGSDLNLDTAFADFACLGSAVGPSPGLEMTLAPAKSVVAPGESVDITITVTNTTDAPIGWGMMTMPGYDLFPISMTDAHGTNVSMTYPCNRGPTGNVGAPMELVIPAHGKGHVKRTWRASRSVDKCGDGTPLDAGTYTLAVNADPAIRVKPLGIKVGQ